MVANKIEPFTQKHVYLLSKDDVGFAQYISGGAYLGIGMALRTNVLGGYGFMSDLIPALVKMATTFPLSGTLGDENNEPAKRSR